jgi:hypothetical protein
MPNSQRDPLFQGRTPAQIEQNQMMGAITFVALAILLIGSLVVACVQSWR